MFVPLKENLIKSNYFKLAKIVAIFHEVRRNRITITAHFMKNSASFFMLKSNRLNQDLLSVEGFFVKLKPLSNVLDALITCKSVLIILYKEKYTVNKDSN